MDPNSWIGPAVTAAIISAVITLFTSHRNHALNYVTSERSSWRLRIKAAIQELLTSFCDSPTTELALQKVKSDINPYGKFATNYEPIPPARGSCQPAKEKIKKPVDNAQYYLSDGHIWNAISDYEKNPTDRDTLTTLITLLELLLKFDWERSKREVAGFSNLLPATLSCVFGALSFCLGTISIADPWIFASFAVVSIIISLLLVLVPPYYLFKTSSSYVPHAVSTFLTTMLLLAPAMVSYFLYFTFKQHLSMLVAAIAFAISGFLSIATFGNRNIERKYIFTIKKVLNASVKDPVATPNEDVTSSNPPLSSM